MAKENKLKKEEKIHNGKLIKIINDFFINYFDWMILFIGLSIIVAGYFMVIKPKYEMIIEDIELVSQDKEREYTVRKAYLNQINNFKKSYEDIGVEDKKRIDKIFYKKNSAEDIFSNFQSIMAKSGLILDSLSFEFIDEGKKENDFLENTGRIKINVEISGTDYGGLKKILREIEGDLNLMDVENINFSPENMHTSLEILTYYEKD